MHVYVHMCMYVCMHVYESGRVFMYVCTKQIV